MQTTVGVLLLGAVTAVSAVVVPSVEPSADQPLIAATKIESRTPPKCDAMPGGFHWRYEDVPRTPNPTGYYWRFAELPKDVQDCWNFGPCTAPKNAAATRVLTVPGAAPKGE